MDKAKTILLEILNITGFSEDKDKFVAEFFQNVSLQALQDLFNSLSQEQKDSIQQKIANAGNNSQLIQDTLKTYFTDLQFQTAIKNSSKNALEEYIKTIEITLSDSQKENLTNYFVNVSEHPNQ